MSLSTWFEKLLGGAAQRSARPRHRQLELETLETRLTPFALSGNAWIHPELITIGFVPDGTVVGSDAQGPIVSNLQSSFNTKFGSAATWQNQILKAAQLWAQQTNINFAVVTDGGSEIGTGLYQQGDPNQADIRIGGYNFGSTTLAQAYMPAPINNTSYAGDVQFNTGQTWNINGTYDLATVAAHEFGHALGLYHSTVSSAVEYGIYNGVKSVLNADDVSGIRAVAGWSQNGFSSPGYQGARLSDSYDLTASNGTSATASDVTSTINAVAKTALVQNLDVTSTTDVDFYKFTVPAGLGGTLTVKAQSSGLSLLAPTLMLYNSAMQQLGTTQTAGTNDFDGSTLSVTTSATAGQTYFVRVAGVNATATGTGKYALSMGFAGVATPAIPLPNTTTINDPIPSAGGGQAVGLGPETRVNTTTAWMQWTVPQSSGYASRPPRAVAMDANGNSVVTWMSYGQIGFTYDIYAQRYNAAGAPQGGEFLVNTTTAGDQVDAAVAMDGAGNFVIAWVYNNGSTYDIYAQRFNAAGTKLGGEFLVNTTTANNQEAPVIARNASGAFVVVWNSYTQDGNGYGVYGQRFDTNGVKQGGEFRVNTSTIGNQYQPAVAMDSNGGFVATWTSVNLSTGASNVFGQRFSATGALIGGEFQVNTSAIGAATTGAIAIDGQGGFVTAFVSSDVGNSNIRVRRFNSSGVALGSDFIASATTVGVQTNPNVAISAGGNFFVTWDSLGQDNADGSSGVYAQQFTSSGARQGSEFRVNTTTAGDQSYSSMAMDGNGDAVIVWSGNGPGDGSGIFLQRYMVSYGGMNPLEAGEAHGYGPDGCGHDHGGEGHSHGAGEEDHGCCSQCGGTPHPANAAPWDGTQELPFLRPGLRERGQTPGSVSLVGRASRLPEGIFRHLAESGVQVGVPRLSGDRPVSSSLTIAAPPFAGAGRLTIAAPSLAGAARAAAGVVGDGLFASLGAEPLDGAGDAFARGLQKGRG